MIDSLYIHIPFCEHICSYCDFCKLIYTDKFAFSYINELKNELNQYKNHKFKTIYVGGGTPSSLPEVLLKDLFLFIKPFLETEGEFTVEVNPENLNKQKALIFKEAGVNRISIGMQTTSDYYLKLLNRAEFGVFKRAYQLLKDVGFNNINIDLIYGLPNEELNQVKEDIQTILDLKPQHISTYSLILEENSIFGKKGIKALSDDEQATQYEYILKTLREANYSRYEVSNFALKGFESRHNLTYWKDNQYVGVGLGASGFINGKRYTNTKNLSQYLRGNYIDFEEKIDSNEDEKYFLLTNLRLENGFSLEDFEVKFGHSFFNKYQEKFEKLNKNLLLLEENGRIKVTDKGMLLLDSVLVDLF